MWKCSSLFVLGLLGRCDAACDTTRIYVPPKGTRVILSGENVIYNGVLYQALTMVGEGTAPPNSNPSAFKKIEDCAAEYRNGKYADCINIPESTAGFSPVGPSKYTATMEGTAYSFKFNCVTGGNKGPIDLETCFVEGICLTAGSASAPSTGGLDCSGASDLPQGNVVAGKYVTAGTDGQKHLLTVAYPMWNPTPTSTGVKDEGICSADSLASRDKIAAQGTADCSTIPEASGTASGTFLVTGPDGRKHRLSCASPTWNPTVGSAGCKDEGVCTPESLSKRGGSGTGQLGVVSCQNVQETSGNVSVAPGRYRVQKKGEASATLYECSSQGSPENCKKIGTCDSAVADDYSKLPPIDCKGKKVFSAGPWFQVGEERIDDDGILRKVLESTNLSPKASRASWQVVGPCTAETAKGDLVDCTSFFIFNPKASYCVNPQNPETAVKLDNKGYRLKYCIDKPGVIPGGPNSDAWELVGQCKNDTADKDPVIDCSNVLKYSPGSIYKRLPVQIQTLSGQKIDLNNYAVKHAGRVYKPKYNVASLDVDGKRSDDEWAYHGLCNDETVDIVPKVDCSGAALMRPGRIISNIQEKETKFVYTSEHNMYGVMEYVKHPHSGVPALKKLMPLGTCMPNTEKGIERSTNIVDCSTYTRWNPRTPYFQTKGSEPVKLEMEGNLYQMKSEYAAFTAPGLDDNQFELIGTCKEGTATGMIEPGPNDFSVDQEIGMRICCPEADCAAYIGVIQCVKKADFETQFGVDFCPIVDPQDRKGFVDEHWKGSWFDRRNYTRDCASVKESQIMDFYPGTVYPSPGNWPDRIVAPYFDAGLAQFPPLEKMITAEKAGSGLKLQHFFAAFVQTAMFGDKCVGAWASAIPVEVGPRGWGEKAGGVATYYYDVLNRIRKNGGDWAVSFGGYNGVELADSEKCVGKTKEETVQKVKNAYKHVIEATGVSHINFDIEGGSIQYLSNHETHWEYRTDALLELMKEMPHLRISHTFPVLPTGLADDGIAYVDLLMRKGVRNDYILAMTMDYGDAVCPTTAGGKTMFECEKSAMEGLAKQVFDLAKKYNRNPGWNSPADVYPILGSIPMIGQNDVVDEIYTYDDAQKAVEWYKQVDLGVSSYWAITRDRSKDDKEQIQVPALKQMQDAIKMAAKPKEKGQKGFADSTSDGVTAKGQAFVYTNIFIDHLKTPLTKKAITPLTVF